MLAVVPAPQAEMAEEEAAAVAAGAGAAVGAGASQAGQKLASDGSFLFVAAKAEAAAEKDAGSVEEGAAAAEEERAAAVAPGMAKLPDSLPGPPSYYPDLRGADVSQREELAFSDSSGGNVINDKMFNVSRADWHLSLGSVVEWRLTGAEAPGTGAKTHPYHQHMTHFQVVDVRMQGPAKAEHEPLVAVGDWRDTLPLYGDVGFTIRFVAPFVGLMMVHCHIQKHSDNGMLALAQIHDAASEEERTPAAEAREAAAYRASVRGAGASRE